MIKEAIKKVLQNENLDAETAEKVMDEIMNTARWAPATAAT